MKPVVSGIFGIGLPEIVLFFILLGAVCIAGFFLIKLVSKAITGVTLSNKKMKLEIEEKRRALRSTESEK